MRRFARSLAMFAAVLPPLVLNQYVQAKPDKSIRLTPIGAYRTFRYDEGASEISAYDPLTRLAFITFAEQPRVEGIDLSDPANPTLALIIDLTPWGGAGAHSTSVAVRDGVLAVAVPQGVEDTAPGKVVFFDTSGNFLSAVTVGALPDMVTFTSNGRFVLAADEGQPRDDYSFDPEGSIGIIDMSRGAAALTDADVTIADFKAFNNTPIDPRIRIYGPGSTVAQDLEPEYVAVAHDSQTAWATLQENNALAVIDLKQKRVTRLIALGYKDHSLPGNGLDGGRDDGGIKIGNWPVLGMYEPDGLATLHAGNREFLITANEGDVREYSGLNAAGSEAVQIEDVALDATAFPSAATIQSRPLGIGRLKVSNVGADTDGDGDYDKLYAFGARSFSVWNEDGSRLFDSGDAFEQITAAAYPGNFNASNTSNTRDDRSDDKGPEPEGVTVAKLFGRDYVFVVLERMGGVMVYDMSNPAAPEFVQYINTRNFGAATNTVGAGDLGPEAAYVLNEETSPTGTPLLIVSNEVSGTLRVFGISKN